MKTIQLQAAYKDYLWGGTKLREGYGKVVESIILNGPYKGENFGTYIF